MKHVFAAVAMVALVWVAPVRAEFGGTHVDTQVEQKDVTTNTETTKTKTVHEENPVDDVTHVKDVTRVHPRIHLNIIERYLHHVIPKDEDRTETRRSVAPAEVEHIPETVTSGAPGAARAHTVVRYHDVFEDQEQTVVHEHPVTDIDHRIHKHVVNVTVHPIVHEHDVTKIVLINHYVPRTEVEHVTATGRASRIVSHRREDIDP